MKKCNRCGAENKDESNFCHSCGAVLNCSKPPHNSKKSFTERFRDSNVVIKIIIVLFIFTIIMVVIGCANYMIFGDPAIPTEEDTTSHLSEFNSLDVDGDGALSFYEVEGLAIISSRKNTKMQKMIKPPHLHQPIRFQQLSPEDVLTAEVMTAICMNIMTSLAVRIMNARYADIGHMMKAIFMNKVHIAVIGEK